MAQLASRTNPSGDPAPFVGLEVATLNADTLRASLRVTGTLVPAGAGLLTSVLRTHIAGGRRYLRVDLAQARIDDPAIIEALVDARHAVAALGGMLVFENAGPRVVDAMRQASLFVRADT
ncbi:STAS domain-containing protein [uncultured Jatrophihabitans sp.]|uniref:STAS domain-containing protein n=1 Tax=uncultured Jatrophihabitans sp. TaxID=1610747 RepID=UPI0035CBBC3E